jgi:hypothetical protein
MERRRDNHEVEEVEEVHYEYLFDFFDFAVNSSFFGFTGSITVEGAA